jgi:hypothetical protein
MKDRISVEDLIKSGNIEFTVCSQATAGKGSKKLTVCIALESNSIWYGIYSGSTLEEEAKTLSEAVDLYNKTNLTMSST